MMIFKIMMILMIRFMMMFMMMLIMIKIIVELFGSESITQVWATIVDFLGDLDPEARLLIRGWLYDDM